MTVQEDKMDKYFLLTFTECGRDGFWHSRHAWFATEDDLRSFVETHRQIEIDLAIEILSCRTVDVS